MPLTEIYHLTFIVLNLFPRSGQFVGPTLRQIQHPSFCDSCSTLPHPSVFVLLDLFIFICNPKFAILLERSDISIELLWVLIMYVVVMTYIWIGQSWIFLYN